MEFGRNTVDWLGLTQMVIGIDTAWITLRAWQQTALTSIEPAPRAVNRSRRKRPAGIAAPRIQLPRGWSLWPKPRPGVRTRSASRSRAAAQPPVLTLMNPQSVRPKRRTGGVFRRRPQVQLAV